LILNSVSPNNLPNKAIRNISAGILINTAKKTTTTSPIDRVTARPSKGNIKNRNNNVITNENETATISNNI